MNGAKTLGPQPQVEDGRFRVALAQALVVVCWMYPAFVAFLQPSGALPSLFFLPTGVGVLDSGRTLLFLYGASACLLTVGFPIKSQLTPWVSAFLGWALLCSLFGAAPVDSLMFSLTWFAAAALYTASRVLQPRVWSPEHRLALLHVYVLLVVLKALSDLMLESGVWKVSGPFQLPNVYGNWLMMLLPLLVHDLFSQDARCRAAAFCSSSVALASLLLTQSRSTWLLSCLTLSLALLLLARTNVRRLLLYSVLIVIGTGSLVLLRSHLGGVATVVGLMLLLLLPGLVESLRKGREWAGKILSMLLLTGLLFVGVNQFIEEKNLLGDAGNRMERLVAGDNSTQTRLELWSAAFSITLEHPVMGTGPATFSEFYPQFQKSYFRYSDSPHSALLEMSSELGLVSVALMLGGSIVWLRVVQPQTLLHDSTRLMALLGACVAIVEAQLDVTYHYAEVWACLALVLSIAAGSREGPVVGFSKSRLVGLAALNIVFWGILVQQRLFESTRHETSEEVVFRRTFEVSQTLPGWSKPILRALEAGTYLMESEPQHRDRDMIFTQLEALGAQARKWASLNPRTYTNTGRAALTQGKLSEAERYFQQAIELDPYNYPAAYDGLLMCSVQNGNDDQARKVVERVLDLYDLDELELAHTGHRDTLTKQFSPLFFHLADYLNPYEQPQKTERFLRFLVEVSPGPRAYYGLGAALWAQGKREEGRHFFEQAHRVAPDFPPPPDL